METLEHRVAFIDVVSWSAGSNIPHNTNTDCAELAPEPARIVVEAPLQDTFGRDR